MASDFQVRLAVDLGASSGRVVAGLWDGGKLQLSEVHRFENGPVAVGGRQYWDLLGLWREVQDGLRKAAGAYGGRIASVGVDTWGVDFGLLGRRDELLGNPYHYRDRRTANILEYAFSCVPRDEIFAQTGLQFMEFNTLFQLLAMRRQKSPLLEMAESLLMIPDLFHWLLTGEKANEFSNATTTQFYDPTARSWALGLLERFELPSHFLGRIVEPGTRLGPLLPAVAEAIQLPQVDVIVPGTHDTASAVMAVPATSPPSPQPDWCYISSGTWSLMGVEVPRPVIDDRCRNLNFTNEGGVGGTIRLLKNIAGLWLLQECRRNWNQSGATYSWDELLDGAERSPPLVSLMNPDHADFVAPQNMPESIRNFCRNTGQPVPVDNSAVVRCALESLALRYRMVLGWLEQLTGGRIQTIHIVGGGTQNRLLCQMTADACNRLVVAGPVEATAIGNLMAQTLGGREASSIQQAREVIRESFEVREYVPRNSHIWDAAFDRFTRIVADA